MRLRLGLAAGLFLVALLLPVHWTASGLAGAGSARLATIELGVWIFKAFLALHAAILAIALRFPLGSGDAAPVPAQRPEGRSGSAVLLGIILVVGLAARLNHLGLGLWFDEIQTLVDYVRLPLGQILTTYDSQNQHMLYSILARFSVDLFGDGAWPLRLPAALMGTASLWAAYRLAARIAGTREALLATALLAFSYHHVWFSQNARGYSGLLLFTLLGTEAFLELLQSPRAGWKVAAGYGVCMALAVYTHVTAAFVAVAHGVVLGILWLRGGSAALPAVRRGAAGLLLAATFSLQLYALVLPQFFQTLLTPTMEGTATAWKDPLWLFTELLGGLARGLPGGWFGLIAGVTVAAAGIWSLWRQSPTVLGLFLLPGLLTVLAVLALKHNLWPRFFFFSAGFAVIIAVRGVFVLARALFRERGELLATGALALVTVASALTVPRAWQPKQAYSEAARFLEGRAAPGDGIVTVDLTSYPYARYLGKSWSEVDNPAALAEVEREHDRTWVVYTFPIRLAAVQPEIWARLTAAYDTAAVFPGSVGGGAIVVVVSRRSGSPT